MGDVERLRLLASAIAGRGLEVAETAPGELPWTDGTAVYIDPHATPDEQVRMVGVQASLLAAGSLAADVLVALLRRPAMAHRYLAIEAHRALSANEAVLPPALRSLVVPSVATRCGSPAEALVVARGREPVDAVPGTFGVIQARRTLGALERAAPARATTALAPSPTTPPAAQLPELVDDDGDDIGDLGHLLSSPVGGGGPVGKLLRGLLRPGRDPGDGGGPPGADAPTHLHSGRAGTGRRVVETTRAAALVGEIAAPGVGGATYPEWDEGRRRYRPDWCTVLEDDVRAGPTAADLPDGTALRRPLARLGLDLTRCRRQPQGDDIDIDAVVEARLDALAGHPHEDDVYVESLRRRRDLAVLVLLDVSGSAGEPGIAGRSVLDHQRDAAGTLAVALHELGDRVALYAFNSRGRRAVQVQRVCAFGERPDEGFARRLAALTPAAYTRLGAAIRHGTSIVEERSGTPRRLLVVLSDGFAYDHGYEARYGEADARRALLEARRRGVGCLCLSVGADVDPAALRRVFGATAHAAVPRSEDLAGVIGPLFRSALRSAEAQRRTFQRTERTKDRLMIERSSDGSSPVLRTGR